MLLHKTIALESAQLSVSDAGTFEGYASVWGGVDSYGDTILPGSFAESIAKKQPKMFFAHRWELPIGRWTSLTEDERGLRVTGELTPGLALAADVGAALRHGTVDGLSIGGYLRGSDYTETDDGRRIIHRWSDLMEISVVPFPADDAARIEEARADVLSAIDAVETIRDFERLLRDAAGFSKTAAVRAVAKMRDLVARREAAADDTAQLAARLNSLLERLK